MSFTSLGLHKPVLDAIRDAGYETPTEIQRQAIPLALRGDDLIALAETGSGKTAAFGLPLLHHMVGERGLRGLILVPTRELCVQVAEQLRIYAQGTDLAVCTAFGGIDLGIQEAAFRRGIDVLVACPGRVIDHLERRNLNLEQLEVVVLDEADRMLDMGFLPQIRSIMVRCPRERNTWLFSATMPPEVEGLCTAFLPDAKRIQVGRRSQAAQTIEHRFVGVDEADKEQLLTELLRRETGRVLVFVNKKTRAERLGNRLGRAGLPADSIHGDKGAEARHVVLRAFDRGKARILVATDVAARGIDIGGVELVVNYDMPLEVEDYIHRVGRTGRAGAEGRAVSLVARAERRVHRAVVTHLNGSARAGGGEDSGDADAAPRKERSNGRPRRRSRKQPATS
ncbi:MAG: DEAD/DEAH box helicase [Planctomycetota bacterium]